jgi:site-specific recombinase XerD
MSTDTTVSPLRQRMIEDMAARKLGAHSQRSHIYSCKRFAAFLERSPDTATADDIRRFQLHLAEADLSIGNRNRIMTGVKFLFRVTLRRHDLAAEIYHLKEPERLPLTMSPNEAERLLTMAGSLRNEVMLSLGYGCGLRAGEIVRLKDGDIDSAQMIIRIVQGKGRKDRQVMLPPELLVSLRQWWKVRPTRFDAGVPAGERWLFPGRRQGLHLTYRQLSRLFHESAAAAGITKRVSLQSLRHSFATDLLEKGIDIRYIQALLGHSKLDTTARYTRVATGRIAAIDSPLKHLGPNHRRLRKKRRSPRAT